MESKPRVNLASLARTGIFNNANKLLEKTEEKSKAKKRPQRTPTRQHTQPSAQQPEPYTPQPSDPKAYEFREERLTEEFDQKVRNSKIKQYTDAERKYMQNTKKSRVNPEKIKKKFEGTELAGVIGGVLERSERRQKIEETNNAQITQIMGEIDQSSGGSQQYTEEEVYEEPQQHSELMFEQTYDTEPTQTHEPIQAQQSIDMEDVKKIIAMTAKYTAKKVRKEVQEEIMSSLQSDDGELSLVFNNHIIKCKIDNVREIKK